MLPARPRSYIGQLTSWYPLRRDFSGQSPGRGFVPAPPYVARWRFLHQGSFLLFMVFSRQGDSWFLCLVFLIIVFQFFLLFHLFSFFRKDNCSSVLFSNWSTSCASVYFSKMKHHYASMWTIVVFREKWSTLAWPLESEKHSCATAWSWIVLPPKKVKQLYFPKKGTHKCASVWSIVVLPVFVLFLESWFFFVSYFFWVTGFWIFVSRFCGFRLFREKKVCSTLLTWDLVLKILAREKQR